MTNTYSFGAWLKQRRKQLKLTQREVATAVTQQSRGGEDGDAG